MLRTPTRSALFLGAVVAACSDVTVPARPAAVASVRVVPFAAWLQPGDTLRLTALPRDADGVPIARALDVAWRSAAPSIATVDEDGLVRAIEPGDAEIVATVEGITGSALMHILSRTGAFGSFRLVTAGDDFTCGVESAGVVVCWGLNAYGQLGNGGAVGGRTPSAVTGPAGATAIAAGTRHACAIDGDMQPWCWGWNSVGQVGLGVSEKIVALPEPVAVEGRFIDVAAGSGHSCALRNDGVVICWGAGVLGQLGAGSLPSVAVTEVAASVTFQVIVAGHAHTCALDTDGSAWCWGWNASGQLGSTTADCGVRMPCSTSPVQVETSLRFTSLAAGSGFTCGLEADGAAHCWGSNTAGQLGGASVFASTSPVRIDGVPPFTGIAAGHEHACGVTETGDLFCWGANAQGQLGDGTTEPRTGPVRADLVAVPGIGVAAGGAHTCAITHVGTIVCWGADAAGQLGLHPVS